MNYIRHLSAFYQKASVDDRLNSAHISLYHALFQFWNMNRFENPVSVNRPQILRYSKIGSNHTFYRCLNDLHSWGYIEYLPSHSPAKGSFVNLCNFDITMNEKKRNIGAKSAQLGCKNDITIGAYMHTSINNINNTNNKTYKEGENQTQKFDESFSVLPENQKELSQDELPTKKAKRKKVALKKEKVFVPPQHNEAVAFFKAEQYPEIEARKFFYHFEANGWKVGGKTPMKNWHAAAHNWMLNVTRFEPEPKLNAVKLNTSKDYGKPL
jgi:hypothetical protein